jgi:hypothetical protein
MSADPFLWFGAELLPGTDYQMSIETSSMQTG